MSKPQPFLASVSLANATAKRLSADLEKLATVTESEAAAHSLPTLDRIAGGSIYLPDGAQPVNSGRIDFKGPKGWTVTSPREEYVFSYGMKADDGFLDEMPSPWREIEQSRADNFGDGFIWLTLGTKVQTDYYLRHRLAELGLPKSYLRTKSLWLPAAYKVIRIGAASSLSSSLSHANTLLILFIMMRQGDLSLSGEPFLRSLSLARFLTDPYEVFTQWLKNYHSDMAYNGAGESVRVRKEMRARGAAESWELNGD